MVPGDPPEGRLVSLPKLTAPQELMVDLLLARARLGEPFWHVSTKLTRTYHELSAKGYVSILSGHVENTVRLMLTAEAKKELLTTSYASPIERQAAEKIAAYLERKGGDETTIRMIRKKFVKES